MSHAYGVEGNITARGINVNIAHLLETGGTLPHGQQGYHLSPLSSTHCTTIDVLFISLSEINKTQKRRNKTTRQPPRPLRNHVLSRRSNNFLPSIDGRLHPLRGSRAYAQL